MEFEKLKKIIAEVLNIDESTIELNSAFVDDLGADSLDLFECSSLLFKRTNEFRRLRKILRSFKKVLRLGL